MIGKLRIGASAITRCGPDRPRRRGNPAPILARSICSHGSAMPPNCAQNWGVSRREGEAANRMAGGGPAPKPAQWNVLGLCPPDRGADYGIGQQKRRRSQGAGSWGWMVECLLSQKNSALYGSHVAGRKPESTPKKNQQTPPPVPRAGADGAGPASAPTLPDWGCPFPTESAERMARDASSTVLEAGGRPNAYSNNKL